MNGSTVPVKIGLIGLGKMGRNHLRVLSMLKTVDLAFVYDRDLDAASALAEKHGCVTAASLEPLLGTADAVVICTPTVTHDMLVRLAAGSVRNIFVEKPLAATLEQSKQLAQFSKDRDLILQVGFIERFNPAVQQLKTVLDASSQVISVDFTRTNKLSARITDVDVVTDLMIHDIDLALFLNGPVRDVSAHGLSFGNMINFASALLSHENGRFSRIQASRITEKKMRSIQATCADMFVDCELLRKELLIHRQSEIEQEENGPYTISSMQQTIEVRQEEALLSELRAFAALCVAGNGDVPQADDAVRAAEICDLVQKAVLK